MINNTVISAQRYHDISCGHRVVNHESKCQHLHGHNYRVHFEVVPVENGNLDDIGRVVDFSVIKSALAMWLEDNWDHKMILWEKDPVYAELLKSMDPEGVVLVGFNPTAENMCHHLLTVIGPQQLPPNVKLVSVTIEETAKCHATAKF